MVENPGTAGSPGGLRLLNQPKPAAIEANQYGEPAAVVVQGRFQSVRTIHDSWRIDDEWWREEIARRYFAIELENGRKMTVYHDLIGDGWFAQSYTGARTAQYPASSGRVR
jgi:hypothetical protein